MNSLKYRTENYNFSQAAVLESEKNYSTISEDDILYRNKLVHQLRKLPKDALQTMRHFQPQVGCLNRCSFCSQSAGTTLWNMSRSDLANLIAALKTVSLELARSDNLVCADPLEPTGAFSKSFIMPPHGLIGHKRNDRPGVIYCYLDNDPASYPYLDDLIQWLYDDLGVKVRIATVGYSRLNLKIQEMHARINTRLMAGVAGVRLSFSPYTYGWTQAAEKTGETARAEFEHDIASMLNTYRPTFLAAKKNRKDASIELRFRPLVVSSSVKTCTIRGHFIINSGPYLVLQKEAHCDLNTSNILDSTDHNTPLSLPGEPCWLVYGDPSTINENTNLIVFELLATKQLQSFNLNYRDALLNKLQNEDGEYFAVDANKKTTGVHAKYFYPKVGKRPGDGYIDGERYLLNKIIKANDISNNKSWHDIENIVTALYKISTSINYDIHASEYIKNQIIPIVESYVRVLKLADYPPSVFFDKKITIETGHICNLGRAYYEYKSIASRPDLPLTPQHERAFGLNGELAKEGIAWRLTVAPLRSAATMSSARGKRNIYCDTPSVVFECLDLAMTATSQGQSRKRFLVPLRNDIEKISLKDSQFFPVIPGHAKKETTQ